MRLHLFIPLVLSVVGGSVFALHVGTAIGASPSLMRLVILACAVAAGAAAGQRIGFATRVATFTAALAAVLLHLVAVGQWMTGSDLFSGLAAPPVLLAAVFSGALISSRFRFRVGGEGDLLSNAATVLLLVCAIQGLHGAWPMSFWAAMAALVLAQFVSFLATATPTRGPRELDLLGSFIGGTLAAIMLTEPPLDFFAVATILGAVALLSVFAAACAILILGILEGIGAGGRQRAPKTTVRVPMARLVRRTW